MWCFLLCKIGRIPSYTWFRYFHIKFGYFYLYIQFVAHFWSNLPELNKGRNPILPYFSNREGLWGFLQAYWQYGTHISENTPTQSNFNSQNLYLVKHSHYFTLFFWLNEQKLKLSLQSKTWSKRIPSFCYSLACFVLYHCQGIVGRN